MARPRKPTAQLELVGAFKHNPDRTRDAEPQCDEDALLPHERITDAEREAWDFLVATAVPGVLTAMDSASLLLCARCLSAVWDGEVNITDSLKVNTMLGKLGMTPSERSRVVVPRKGKTSRVGGLARKA